MGKQSPLEILLEVMRQKYEAGDFDGAASLARAAAPYLHGKVPPSRPVADLSGVSDDDLDAFERRHREGC